MMMMSVTSTRAMLIEAHSCATLPAWVSASETGRAARTMWAWAGGRPPFLKLAACSFRDSARTSSSESLYLPGQLFDVPRLPLVELAQVGPVARGFGVHAKLFQPAVLFPQFGA